MCHYGEVTVVDPAAQAPNDSLSLTFLPGETDAAAALGWKAGIPGAVLILAPSVQPRADTPGDTATGPPIGTLFTDSAGHVSVPDLPGGWYYVEVRRWLSDAERAKLASGEDLIGFMTQQAVERGSNAIYVPGSRRQSILLSEVSFYPEWVPGVGSYGYGGYAELANNSDTTVYLDGLVIGVFMLDQEQSSGGHCAAAESFDNDPDGVWVYYMDSLPGTGHDYPLAPGAVTVLATDAIDHRANSPQDGLDLSHANFEMPGEADVDNPGVPNSVVIGTNGWYGGGYTGHGMQFSLGAGGGIVVALPVDTTSLPRGKRTPGSAYTVQRLPRSRILDVFVTSVVTDYFITSGFSYCPHQVNNYFDHSWPPWGLYTPPEGWRQRGRYSVQRKVAYTRSDGRKILQDTRSTEADFSVRLRTPFALP